MTIITSSFVTQVEDAICAEVLRLCGTGVEAYDDPDYLQLATARRGRVAQGFDVTAAEKPAFVIEYIYSDEIGPGGQTRGGDYRHVWNVAVLLTLTAEGMGYDPLPSKAAFYTAVVASADVMMRRVHRALRSFAPTVIDTDYDETASNVEMGIYRFLTRMLDDYAAEVTILYEVTLPAEDLS